MKYLLIISLLIFAFRALYGQPDKVYDVKLVETSLLKIDSVIENKSKIEYRVLSKSNINIDRENTPEKTLIEFTSFNNREWARKIVDENYNPSFPSKIMLKQMNSKTYRQKAYIKFYFTAYFKNDSVHYAGCLVETYITKDLPAAFLFLTLKIENGKWVYTQDKIADKVSFLAILKPKYLLSLLSGKKIKGESKYNELFSKVFNNNTINLKTFNTMLINRERKTTKQKKKEMYTELINKKSLTYIINNVQMKY